MVKTRNGGYDFEIDLSSLQKKSKIDSVVEVGRSVSRLVKSKQPELVEPVVQSLGTKRRNCRTAERPVKKKWGRIACTGVSLRSKICRRRNVVGKLRRCSSIHSKNRKKCRLREVRVQDPIEESLSSEENSPKDDEPSVSSEENSREDDPSVQSLGAVSEDSDMSTQSSIGSDKEGTSGDITVSSDDDLPQDEQILPKRLFGTDRYPMKGRVNSYSKLEYVFDILDILDGSPEYVTLMQSPFASLFSLQVRRCSLSGRLVHNFLCRQLVTKNKDELWFTFGGQPLRFSLLEFEKLTGLPCGPYPTREAVAAVQAVGPSQAPYWYTLIGRSKKTTIKQIVALLKANPGMPGWRKLRLVLVVIVEGILSCGRQPVRPSVAIVEMVKDLNFFLSYPWGRHSFELTLRMLKVGKKVCRLSDVIKKLKQQSVVIHGFPIAIQFFLFESLPRLLDYLPGSDDHRTFLDRGISRLPPLKTYHTENLLMLENYGEMLIERVIDIESDEVDCSVGDPRVHHLQSLLVSGFKFSKGDWDGGDTSLPVMCICKKRKNYVCKCGSVAANQLRSDCCSGNATIRPKRHVQEIVKLRAQISRIEKEHAEQIVMMRKEIVDELRLMLEKEYFGACKVPKTDSFDESLRFRRPASPNQDPCTSRRPADGVVHSNSCEDNILPPSPRINITDSHKEQTLNVSGVSDGDVDNFNLSKTIEQVSANAFSDFPLGILSNVASDPAVGMSFAQQEEQPAVIDALVPFDTVFGSGDGKFVLANSNVHPVPVDAVPPLSNSEVTAAPGLTSRKRLRLCSCKGFKIHESVAKRGKQIVGIGVLYDPFPVVPSSVVAKLKEKISEFPKELYDLDGFDVSKSFFSDIYTPQRWLNGMHMDFILRPFWSKWGVHLAKQRVVVLDTHFTHLLSSEYVTFLQSKHPESHVWHPLLASYIDGTITDRTENTEWFKDVDTVYAAMNWGNKHWVGVVILLKSWHIEILDPIISLTSDRRVASYMAPLVKTLPSLLKSVCDPAFISHVHGREFSFARVQGLPQNEITGDCGPFTMKLLEMHAHNLSVEQMGRITETMVASFRMHYAVDVYEEFIDKLSTY